MSAFGFKFKYCEYKCNIIQNYYKHKKDFHTFRNSHDLHCGKCNFNCFSLNSFKQHIFRFHAKQIIKKLELKNIKKNKM